MDKTHVFDKIHAIARSIPAGSVATYGQIARLAGLSRGARVAGWAMMSTPRTGPVPAHRVIHADGTLCSGSDWEPEQRRLLVGEGIVFDSRGRVDMSRCQIGDDALFARMEGLEG